MVNVVPRVQPPVFPCAQGAAVYVGPFAMLQCRSIRSWPSFHCLAQLKPHHEAGQPVPPYKRHWRPSRANVTILTSSDKLPARILVMTLAR
jgi:hypothetical protein